MIKLTGTYYTHGKPARVTVTPNAVTFHDYDWQHICRVHRVELDTHQPIYGTGTDITGKAYETISWVGDYSRSYGECTEAQIQTWDRHTIFVRARWLHYRDGYYPGAYKIMAGQGTIIDLDDASAVKLAALLESLKHPQETLL